MTTVPTKVERLWPGSTIVCVGTGPSLIQSDVEYCRGKARVIVVNDAWKMAPWAEVMYACDGRFWDYYKGVPEFAGLKYGLTVKVGKWPNVERLVDRGAQGLETNPIGVRTGFSSGYQAINLAVHLGAASIVLLGYDLQLGKGKKEHFFGRHPPGLRQTSPLDAMCRVFRSLVPPLANLGIDIVNCSRETALPWFRRAPLEDVVRVEVAA